jgi:pimeloyl-ACP methyl ester carboxylesterase
MASHDYDSPAGAIHYERRGLGDPVLLVHGLYVGASHREFDRNLSALARHFTVYAIDLLGFGHSYAPRTTHTADLHHHLVRDFIIDVVGEKTHLVASGASCGIATKLGVYDDTLLDRCVLLCPTAGPQVHAPPHLSERITQFLLGTLALGGGFYDSVRNRASLQQFLQDRYADPGRAYRPEKLDELEEIANLPDAMYGYLALVNHYFDVDVFEYLRHMRPAVQVIWGEALGEPPRRQVFAPAVWSRGHRLDVIPGARHWPHDEQSAATNEAILAFLRADSPVAAAGQA